MGLLLTGPLRGLRIAAVPYLNAKPLVHGLANIRTGVPSELALALEQGRYDLVAALSIGATLAHPRWRVLPSLGVAADGPVRTVMLLHRPPLSEIDRIAFDPASRTSNLLAKWIVRSASGAAPVVDPSAPSQVVIGDPAFAHEPSEGTDLAEAWKSITGLPFVFAGWVAGETLSKDRNRLQEIDAFLSQRHEASMAAIGQIARSQSVVSATTAEAYLGSNIQYRLDARFRAGADRFARELQQSGEGTGSVPWAC